MWLLDYLQPKSILAIGRDAQGALADLEVKSLQVRHPSYGGQTEFLNGTYAHYGVSHTPQPETIQLF